MPDATVQDAADALARGDPVLVYDADDREAEVDMVYAAEHVDHHAVATMRQDAGGLICCALHPDAADALGFPYLADRLDTPMAESRGDLSYDDRSAFSYPVNHVDTRTGVTDRDRATTITALADAAATVLAGDAFDTATAFRTPGHVPVLRAHADLLDGRRGHTELSIALAAAADITPAAVVCEMLDAETGDALPAGDARAYAAEYGVPFLAGDTVVTGR